MIFYVPTLDPVSSLSPSAFRSQSSAFSGTTGDSTYTDHVVQYKYFAFLYRDITFWSPVTISQITGLSRKLYIWGT
ncbi:hypothetical protein K435DRAFT_786399 [Dendrothele bispora CBS 962.96]|uniref:Uncharacterized protein n=1 Tax=Dendrothele bispora (strain CBS 962.96) TaxID=1314807 RepID=A0A4S8KQS9_DENBC|nr:hypothetical protein K435DRAFT_786399 [Dendrothele bispora CBS 962.96]